jgi:predicted lipid-binding transport protein (Tim44 family)
LVIAANYTQQIAADVSNEQNNLQNLLKTTVNNQILLQESNTSLQVLNQVTAQVEAEALQNNPDAGFGDIFGGLVGFLVGVGDWTASEADKAVSGLEALTGTLANALGSAFGSVGGFVAMIFIGIVILAVIGVVIWVIVKFACKKTADPQTSQLQKDVEGLKKFTGYKEPVETTPAPAADVPKTSGKRSSNRSRSAGKVKGHRYSEVETSAV